MAKGSGGFLNPEKVIEEFGIKEGMKIADFGCGAGYFAIPMAELVDKKGRVYALDVLRTSLEAVKNKARARGLLNIIDRQSNLEVLGGSKIEENSADLVLVANILFQSSQKNNIIKEAGRILKKGGKMIIIEWEKNQPMGPPEKLLVSKKSIRELAEKQGFKFKKEISAGKYHWGMAFIKS